MRASIPVWILFLLGMLLSVSACNSQTAPSTSKASPTIPTQASISIDAAVSSPAKVDLMKNPTKPFAVAKETAEKGLETTMTATESLTITIFYDNNPYDERLQSAWGFAALVEYCDHNLLFDTGGDGSTLMENMRILGIDPTQIESIVLSHAHGDHTGGLSELLELENRPTVYLTHSFSSSFKNQVGRETEVIEVTPGLSFFKGMYSTGEMGGGIREQALIVQTKNGLVIVTGCAHPGVVKIIQQARALFDGRVRLVLGGFHLGSKREAEINTILRDFRRLGVEQLAPCHCTGENAIALFAREYESDFIQTGVGKTIILSGE
jgi:7,8-dihydropterin-6-yl-methyl-4-(beta-D-ribofuranosyl)aminobenzene 5'-phosphate synthase